MALSRFFHTFVAAGLLGFTATAFAASLVPVKVGDLFIPKGFDDNDQTTLVVDGYLPNGCYRLDKAETKFDHDKKTITIEQFARIFPAPCILMIIPYRNEINLGVVPKGDYKVVTNDGRLVKDLSVTGAANEAPDDFLYVPVDSARVERANGKYTAVLEGRFTNTCMKFKEIKITYSGATIELLPIMEIDESENCTEQQVPFRREVVLENLENGSHLLHVRSLNGRAANAVFEVY